MSSAIETSMPGPWADAALNVGMSMAETIFKPRKGQTNIQVTERHLSKAEVAAMLAIAYERGANDADRARAPQPAQKTVRVKRPTPQMVKVLESLAAGRSATDHLRGQSQFGGFNNTRVALLQRGWMDDNWQITPAGREALQRAKG